MSALSPSVTTLPTTYHCLTMSFGGRAQMLEMLSRFGVRCRADHRSRHSAWRSSRRVRQHSIRCTTAHHCCLVGRAQVSHIDDAVWRAVHFRPSMSPPVHGGVAFVCANVAFDVPLLAVVVWRDERRCRTMSTRRGALCSVDHRPRCPCTVAPPSCAPRLPMMYQCSLWWNGGPRADFGQCRLVEARGEVWTIDLAARVRWHGSCVRQRCLRCTSTRCRHSAGRVQMSDNVDSSRRAVQCRPSTSPPVRGGAAVVCAKVAHYVPVLTVIVWWDARRCWSMPTRRGARRSVD
jgi:hypothetical protein